MGLKIAVMGTGAVGGYAGAHMAQAGEDITFIDPWPEHVETMRAKGLRISHIRDVPEFTAKVRAMHLTDVQQFVKEKPIDLAFVCVKSRPSDVSPARLPSSYASPAMCAALRARAGRDTRSSARVKCMDASPIACRRSAGSWPSRIPRW